MFRKYPKLFTDPGITYPVYDLTLPFSDYIHLNKQLIRETRVDLQERADHIVDCNAPFELFPEKKAKKGALLIHGLTDSAFILREMGDKLQADGYLVRSILLPGHGTVPGALLHVTLEDWIQAVNYGITSLKKEVEDVFLVGFSTGAALSVYHTLHHPDDIKGLALLAPAFKINSAIDFASNWHTIISDQIKSVEWLFLSEENDYTKYHSFAYNAVYQVYRLTLELKKLNETHLLQHPAFTVLNYNDSVVSSKVALEFFDKNRGAQNQMLCYTDKKLSLNDPQIEQKSSVYPDWRIKSLSHVGMPLSPNNFHYGIHGDYPLASRVMENSRCTYGEMTRTSYFYYGLLKKIGLTKNLHQFLTFNPDFEFMAERLVGFFNHIS